MLRRRGRVVQASCTDAGGAECGCCGAATDRPSDMAINGVTCCTWSCASQLGSKQSMQRVAAAALAAIRLSDVDCVAIHQPLWICTPSSAAMCPPFKG